MTPTEAPVAEEAPQTEVETPVEASPPDDQGAPPGVEDTRATEQTPDKLFRFSDYVAVGEGAEECVPWECENGHHFHAWCRLPNQFQHDSIRTKALAAKARKIRQLKDPESDSHAILEADLEAIKDSPGAKGWLVEDLVNREFLKNHSEAMQDANEEEEFATITEDLERLRILDEQEPEQRDHDEYVELQNHIQKYNEYVEKARAEREKPLRDALEEKEVDELISQVRDERIEAEATQEFMRAYSQWEWYTCTMKPRDPAEGLPKDRVWPHINEMISAAPEVLEAVDKAFSDLEGALSDQGNS